MIAVVLIVAQIVVNLLSWIVSATGMNSQIHSLISAEGARWFFGHFTDNLASPLLVWIILSIVAISCVRNCGLLSTVHRFFTSRQSVSFREKLGFQISIVLLILYILIMVLLTAIPHAILLSSTGSLFPSAFSVSIIPVIAFICCVISIIFGMLSGHFLSFYDVFNHLSTSIEQFIPLIIYYILGMQLYACIMFVFV